MKTVLFSRGRRADVSNATDAADPPVNATGSSFAHCEPVRYDGFLLRLLLAFDAHRGIPFGAVNLLTGVHVGETTLEFKLLGRLTEHPVYGRAARRAVKTLWLVPNAPGLTRPPDVN